MVHARRLVHLDQVGSANVLGKTAKVEGELLLLAAILVLRIGVLGITGIFFELGVYSNFTDGVEGNWWVVLGQLDGQIDTTIDHVDFRQLVAETFESTGFGFGWCHSHDEIQVFLEVLRRRKEVQVL